VTHNAGFTLNVYNMLRNVVNKIYTIRFGSNNVNFVDNVFQNVIKHLGVNPAYNILCCDAKAE
jgi:hypothetical protein